MKACTWCGLRIPTGSRCDKHKTQRLPRQQRGHGAEYQRLRAQVIAEEFECGICGVPFYENEPVEVDYIIPYSKGGELTRENLQAAHPRCNRSKAART
jgi:5-methylcytosine-specific restriction endonuclease McrA